MILRFKAKNFYSIGNEINVSFCNATKKLYSPDMYFAFNSSDSPINVNKVTFLGGANGSGKTNILKVLSFLRFMIVDSNLRENTLSQKLPYEKFIASSNESTDLSVDFSVGADLDCIYSYSLSLSNELILSEELSVNRLVNKRRTSKPIYSRNWNNKNLTYEYTVNYDYLSNLKNIKDLAAIMTKSPKTSFISLFYSLDLEEGILRAINDYWSSCYSNIIMVGNRDAAISLTNLSSAVLGNLYNNDSLRKQACEILKKYDLGFNDIAKISLKVPAGVITNYGIEHKYGDSMFSLGMGNESTGTQRIVTLLEGVLQALNTPGGVAIMDEIDAYLHPFILEDIINLFASDASNKNGAQLVFSAQSYSILNKLDKQQILLSEKDSTGQTDVWRLDEMEGNIRNDENFYAKYILDSYGGVPNVG